MLDKLSNAELALIDRDGERIKNGLSNLVAAFPNHAKTITGMANWLSANKSTCQRMVETINKAIDGTEVIVMLPGPAGVSSFIDLAEERHVNTALIDKARKVVIRFENLIYEYSRSHTALKNRIRFSTANNSGKANKQEQKEALYEAAKAITGENIETGFKFFILKDSELDNKYLQQFTLSYHENCTYAENARPMMFAVAPNEQELTLEQADVLSINNEFSGHLPPFSIIKELTSKEVLNSVNEAIVGDSWVVLPTDQESKHNINIGIIKNYPQEQLGPFYGGKKASCVSALIRGATKRLNFVCFLERKYAMRSVANIGIYSTHTKLVNMIASPESLWFDRFQDDADLGLYNTDTNFSEKLEHPKANQLVDSFFELTGCDRTDFACYMIKVDYPIWASQYRLYFQYAID